MRMYSNIVIQYFSRSCKPSHLKFKFKILKNSEESEGVIEKQVLSYREKCMQPTTLNPQSESWVWIKQHKGKTKQHLPNTRTSVLTRQVTHAIISCSNHTIIHNTKISFSFKQQIKTFLQHIYFFFQRKQNKTLHCRQQKRQISFSINGRNINWNENLYRK